MRAEAGRGRVHHFRPVSPKQPKPLTKGGKYPSHPRIRRGQESRRPIHKLGRCLRRNAIRIASRGLQPARPCRSLTCRWRPFPSERDESLDPPHHIRRGRTTDKRGEGHAIQQRGIAGFVPNFRGQHRRSPPQGVQVTDKPQRAMSSASLNWGKGMGNAKPRPTGWPMIFFRLHACHPMGSLP